MDGSIELLGAFEIHGTAIGSKLGGGDVILNAV